MTFPHNGMQNIIAKKCEDALKIDDLNELKLAIVDIALESSRQIAMLMNASNAHEKHISDLQTLTHNIKRHIEDPKR